MELGFFLLELLPAESYDSLMEEAFSLCYLGEGGFSFTEVKSMTRREREWLLQRLAKAKRAEAEAIKNAKS